MTESANVVRRGNQLETWQSHGIAIGSITTLIRQTVFSDYVRSLRKIHTDTHARSKQKGEL